MSRPGVYLFYSAELKVTKVIHSQLISSSSILLTHMEGAAEAFVTVWLLQKI